MPVVSSAESLSGIVIPSALTLVSLLGLLDKKEELTSYKSINQNSVEINIYKYELPNQFARIDVIKINTQPVGSIVSIELLPHLYHMVGMFIKEGYRGKNVVKVVPGYYSSLNSLSPAALLLTGYVEDMVVHNNRQISLEVKNNNTPAWKLYEMAFVGSSKKRIPPQFTLLDKNEYLAYARLRGKKIGKWHEVVSTNGRAGQGVQWSHIPDYGNSSRWSINRVYYIKPQAEEAILLNRKLRLIPKLKVLWTVIRYGRPASFIYSKLLGQSKENFKTT